MSNFQDAISAEDLKALYTKASTKEQMTQDAPWKGTGESVGDSELGIIQQAIDAVDDNCEFPIYEFLKGSHFSLFLYLRNIEMQLEKAMEEGDKDVIMALSMQFGQVQSIYGALTDILPAEEGDEDEDA
jgi:hypothetical protein